MKNKLQVFENENFGKVRVVEINGVPWFVGKDVTDILGYTNPSKALRDHVDDEDKLNNKSLSSLGQRGGWIINESGLYSLMLQSKLPTAKRFKRWVTSEILPSIRQHGAYVTDEVLEAAMKNQDFAFDLLQKLLAEKGKNIELQGEVKSLMPKAQYCDVILQCKNTVPVSIVAKDYGYSAVAFNRLLHSLRIQYKCGKTWLLYQCFAGQGYTQSRTYYTADGIAVIHTHWTQKGRMFLYHALHREGILPMIERIEALESFIDSCDDFDYEDDYDLDFYDEDFEVYDFNDYDFEEELY
jgi:Prophage antirepressor